MKKEGLDIRHKSTGKQPSQELLFIIWCSCLKAQLAQIVVFPLHHTKPACAFPHARTHARTRAHTPFLSHPIKAKQSRNPVHLHGCKQTRYNFPYFCPLSNSEIKPKKGQRTGGVAGVGKSLEPSSSMSLHNRKIKIGRTLPPVPAAGDLPPHPSPRDAPGFSGTPGPSHGPWKPPPPNSGLRGPSQGPSDASCWRRRFVQLGAVGVAPTPAQRGQFRVFQSIPPAPQPGRPR